MPCAWLACLPRDHRELASCTVLTGMSCAAQVGNPLLPGTKSKMLPDTDFTHQQYYEVGCAALCLILLLFPCQPRLLCIRLRQPCMSPTD